MCDSPDKMADSFFSKAQVGRNISLTNHLLSILLCLFVWISLVDEEDHMPKSVLLQTCGLLTVDVLIFVLKGSICKID